MERAEEDLEREEDIDQAAGPEKDVKSKEDHTEEVAEASKSGDPEAEEESVKEQKSELGELQKGVIGPQKDAEETARDAENSVSAGEKEVDEQIEETGSFIREIGNEVQNFMSNPNGHRAERLAKDISDKIAQAEEALRKETEEEAEIVQIEEHEGKNLERLAEEEDFDAKELGEEIVITKEEEEVAERYNDEEFYEAEEEIHETKGKELAELDEEEAENLELAAKNTLHAQKEIGQTKSEAKKLEDISTQFINALKEANIGERVAKKSIEKTSRALDGLDNLVTECNQLLQETAKAGQGLPRLAKRQA